MDKYMVVDRKEVRAGRFDVVCETILNDGVEYPFSYVKVKDCAAAFCTLGDKIILLKQYRHILDSWEWEIPAGSVEKGENAEDTVLKEIVEETGYKVKSLFFMGWYHLSVGSTTERVFLYWADCEEGEKQNLEALEKIEVHKITIEQFKRMIKDNTFHQCMGVTAWERYCSLKDEEKDESLK
ncbi:NUDIX hydrolase [Butyrivibrio fibrisolvens]|uniref:NUDIX hydrolase n=1 Tax=Butyrivibrio fibrisolvens TaxID=831 RepID=UPI00040E675D|nr:NUDIX hydrolase [Butyrivibrio fibrisolvens]